MVVFYRIESSTIESFVVDVPRSAAAVDPSDPVVCHCLQVPQSSVVEAVREGGARSLCELARLTGAGSGCTSCHRRLRQFFNTDRNARTAEARNAASCPE